MALLEKLQNLDDVRKKKIMIIATVIIMCIVVWLWLAYFNSIVISAKQ